MKITFHGAARSVTGSRHLIQVNGHTLLLECGLYQGAREEAYERNRRFPFDPGVVEAVILSHAHIDHSGNLPNLVKRGFRGPVYATRVTAHLTKIMLLDSAQIQEAEAEEANQVHSRRGDAPLQPLYTTEEVGRVEGHFQPLDYDEPFEVIPGVEARLVEAGHILGSAAAVLDIEENGNKRRLWFSGDIGRRNIPLVRDPVLPGEADYLIMESTYGDKSHASPFEALEELRQVVSRTVARGGKVIVPAFAVGRTQELVYNLHQMIDRREIPLVQVYVDSPLAVEVSDIFNEHPEYFDQETHDFMAQDTSLSALDFELVTYTRTVEQSRAVVRVQEPMVVIATSGMAETGRVLHHLKSAIGDERNTILITSWQAPGTLGRQLAEGARQVEIRGEVHERRAEIVTISGLSAHAGQNFLAEYALAVKEQVKGVFLVHGEAGPAQALQQKLAEAGLSQVHYPDLHEVVEV